jgi:hypothetical protein
MFWWMVLPFKLTCASLFLLVVYAGIRGRSDQENVGKALVKAGLLGLIAFVPACVALNMAIDARRFGTFEYGQSVEIRDQRIHRYLPSAATDITLHKYNSGYQAKYRISEKDLIDCLDSVWAKYGDQSVHTRKEPEPAYQPSLRSFEELGWAPLEDPIRLGSPRAGNVAGADYYFDRATGTVYQRSGYW